MNAPLTDGVVLVLDFTGADGQPVRPPPDITRCERCGHPRKRNPGAHSPTTTPAGTVDCKGFPLELDGRGYFVRKQSNQQHTEGSHAENHDRR